MATGKFECAHAHGDFGWTGRAKRWIFRCMAWEIHVFVHTHYLNEDCNEKGKMEAKVEECIDIRTRGRGYTTILRMGLPARSTTLVYFVLISCIHRLYAY